MAKLNGVTEVNGVSEYKYFVGGEWRSAEGNKLFDVYRPYDRALYARVAAGRKADDLRARLIPPVTWQLLLCISQNCQSSGRGGGSRAGVMSAGAASAPRFSAA